MKIKTHLTYALLCCALSTAVISCSKEKEELTLAAADSKINPEKLEKIEAFMITKLGVSPDAKKHNETQEEFYVGKTTMNRAEIEKLYDSSLLAFINSLDIRYFNSSPGVAFNTNPNTPTNLSFDFTIEANDSTLNSKFKVQVIYYPLTGQPEVIADNGVATFRGRQATGYTWDSKITATLAAGKTTGRIGLRLITGTSPNESTTNSINNFHLIPFVDPNSIPNPFDRSKDNKIVGVPHFSPPALGTPNVFFPSGTPVLTSGQAIYSPNGQYFFILQTDGSLVLYNINWQILWSADSYQKGGKYLFFAPDGNLVLAKNADASGVVWAANIYSSTAASNPNPRRMFYMLQDDGNLVFYWDGGTYTERLGDTGTSGGKKSSHYRKIL